MAGARGKMVNLGDVGIICLNRDLTGHCADCLWREWDSGKQQCCNWGYPICHVYREHLFKPAGARPRPGLAADGSPAGAGSVSLPGAGAGEPGTA